MSTVARFTESHEDGRRVLRFQGDLTLSRLGVLPTRLERLKGDNFVIDLSEVGRMDTIGAWIVHRTARDRHGEIVGAQGSAATLLRQVERADRPVKVRPDPPSPIARVLSQVGAATMDAGRTFVGLIGFLGGMLIAL
ncbi:MAG: phospholipid/cholesterol/gamma-HCH transport system permease protein, partial [Sphingomonadales bacterium]|nr:phospholipid/cholesterol/gamma-HCH transport system permease protein [Sphingomonadales bacterium]